MGVFLKIWIWFLSGVYKICSWIYKIFIALAGKQLVSTATFQTIVNNTYIIIGVVMLFILSFSLLKGMVNPDDSKAGTSTIRKIVINLVTSVAILAVTPMVFNFAYDVQDSIINYNTIGGFFGFGSLGDSGADSNDNPATVAANQIVNSVWTAFFNVDEEWCFEQGYPELQSCQEQIKAEKSYIDGVPVNGGTFKDVINSVDETGHFNMYNQFADEADDGSIAFYGFLALIGGVALLYVSVSYTFGLAKRLVKLFFYEVIAPVPILLRVVPSGKASGMFNQWLKITLTCYAEVFVRIFILYFCLFICMEIRGASFFDSVVPSSTETILYSDSNTNYFENNNYTLAYADEEDYFENKETMLAEGEEDTETTAQTTSSGSGGGWFLNLITKAFLYMGIFMFMKSAPKIISEVTGIDSGNMKLGIKDMLKSEGLLGAGAAVVSGVGGLITGHSPLAAYRAAKSGWKNNNLQGIGAEASRRASLLEARRNGSTFFGRSLDRGRRLLGLESNSQRMDRRAEEGRENPAGYGDDYFVAENDTRTIINLTDADGNVIDTIAVGGTVEMSREMQEQIETTQKANAAGLSHIAEILRQISESEQSNSRLISLRSDLKKEAEDKIAEGNSDILDTIHTSYGDFTGNYAGMQQYLENARQNGASDAQLQEIVQEIGDAKDRMWKDYARKAINDPTNTYNAKIRNISDQMAGIFARGGLQQGVGEAYDQAADALGLAAQTGFDLVEGLDKAAKTFNNAFVLQKQDEQFHEGEIKAQNTGLERLTTQLKEHIEVSKRSAGYRAAQANDNFVNKNNSGKNG